MRAVRHGGGGHHCGLPNVLLEEFEEGLVPDRDFVLGPGLFFQNGIRRSFGSGMLIGQTCERQLVLRAVAIVSKSKEQEIHRHVGNIRPLQISLK